MVSSIDQTSTQKEIRGKRLTGFRRDLNAPIWSSVVEDAKTGGVFVSAIGAGEDPAAKLLFRFPPEIFSSRNPIRHCLDWDTCPLVCYTDGDCSVDELLLRFPLEIQSAKQVSSRNPIRHCLDWDACPSVCSRDGNCSVDEYEKIGIKLANWIGDSQAGFQPRFPDAQCKG